MRDFFDKCEAISALTAADEGSAGHIRQVEIIGVRGSERNGKLGGFVRVPEAHLTIAEERADTHALELGEGLVAVVSVKLKVWAPASVLVKVYALGSTVWLLVSVLVKCTVPV